MYDIRQPLGSSWRVAAERKIMTMKAIPITEVIRVRSDMAQGEREAGRRGGSFESCILSMSRDCLAVGTAPVSRSDEEEDVALEDGGLSTDPFRASAGFQLKFPERRLLADVGLEVSGLGRRGSRLLGIWLGGTSPGWSGWPGTT
jgi:hypothetical protein